MSEKIEICHGLLARGYVSWVCGSSGSRDLEEKAGSESQVLAMGSRVELDAVEVQVWAGGSAGLELLQISLPEGFSCFR